MDVSTLAAYSVGMAQGMQKQEANVAMTKQAIESNTAAAQMLSEQVADQAKAAAAAASGGINIKV